MSTKPNRLPGLTPRVLFIALIIAPVNCYLLIQMELVRNTFASYTVPLSNVILILAVLTLINHVIGRLAPRLALRQDEMLVLYVMLSLITTMVAYDITQALLTLLGYPFRFATLENEFEGLFWEHLPRWLTVSNTRALRGFYTGGSSLYLTENLKVWVPVVFGWILLFMVLGFIFLCLNAILRRQWTERERLTYPIIQLPLEMTSATSGFFRNKRMWIGFGIAAVISLFNGVSYLYPAMPSIPVTSRYIHFNEPPLSYYRGASIAFYPFSIGILFLMPLDVLFSTGFFYALTRNQRALSDAMGWRTSSNFPYINEQAVGAFLALCIYLFWVGRQHFSSVLKSAFKRGAKLNDSDEPLPYHVAVWGLFLGLFFFAFLLHRAGMAFWLALMFAALVPITPIITTRIRAEAGIFVHAYHWQQPKYALVTALGTRRLGARNLTALIVCAFNREYRAQQMPHQLEAFKISEEANINKRRMFVAILVASMVGLLLSFWIQLHLYYRFGGESGYFCDWTLGEGTEFFGRLRNWIYYPTNTDSMGLLFTGIGFSTMAILTYLRVKFFWLPLHPLGYAMASNQGLDDLWLPILICFILKWIILKYGGIRSYRNAVPFFLGLAFGDYLMGILWNVLGVMLNMNVYQFFP